MLIATIGSLFFSLSFFLNFIYYFCSFFVSEKSRFLGIYHKSSGFLINSLLICSFLMFILCFAYSDFSLYSVFINSHTAKPLVYKVGAAWGSHEGSMLFWLFILAIYNLFYYFSRKNLEDFATCHFQSFFSLIIQGFVFITVDPFRRSNLIPNEGNGFNPLLQDYALLIHPPILYLGYAGNLISFSIIVASAFRKNKESFSWIRESKTWILIPWSFLTLGVGLGSWWSYRELGWGGFWAWDPVENVSLLPWLAGLTFIHLTLIKNKTYLIQFLLKLNGVLIFIFSLFATFIVRSGIVTSIHAFATSNERGWYFLILLGVFSIIGIGSITFFDKYTQNNDEINDTKSIKDKILIYGSSLTTCGYLLIVMTIVAPIYLNVYHGEIVNIGEDFYRKTFSILFLPILILIAAIPYIYQKNKKILLINTVISILFSGIFTFFLKTNSDPLTLANIFLINLIIVNYCIEIVTKILRKEGINLPSALAHSGLCIMMLGAIVCTLNDASTEKLMDINGNKEIVIHDYRAILNKVEKIENSDFVGIKANFSIWHKNQELGNAYPEVKFYKIEKMQLPDSSSFYHHFSDIYLLVTGVDGEKNMIMVKIFFKKYVMLIWIGCGMIGVSGFLILLRSFLKIQLLKDQNKLPN